MGQQTIIHGRISLKGDFEKSREFIRSLNNDDTYPWIRTEMFNVGASERPYYYEQPIIAFAADYKNLEYDFTSFIIKFENVLKNIEFDTAKIQMETEFYGTYNFFWKSRSGTEKFEEKEQLIETGDWYFGYGYRCRWGLLDIELKEEHVFAIDFAYPVKFDPKTLAEFTKAVKEADINQEVYIMDRVKNLDKLYPILIYGSVIRMFNFGFEPGKGYWIKKLKEIEIQ
jgi:hypothetical protein